MIYRVKCTASQVGFLAGFLNHQQYSSNIGGFECCCFNFIPNKFGKDYKNPYLISVQMGWLNHLKGGGGLFWCLKNQFWKSRTKLIGWKTGTISRIGNDLGVSLNGGYPQIFYFYGLFHYKPSILGYPYFWKHPFSCIDKKLVGAKANSSDRTSGVVGKIFFHPRQHLRKRCKQGGFPTC